jgi:CBS domain-containing protein
MDHTEKKIESKEDSNEDLGDSMYSTAPSSPEQLLKRKESYDENMKKNDHYWDWHTGTNVPVDGNNQRSKPVVSSPPVPKHVGSLKGRGVVVPQGSSASQRIPPEVVSANPAHVQVGFDAPEVSGLLETTKLSSLPGTMVITSPPSLPKPHPPTTPPSLTRPKSIEEIDHERKNYVPVSAPPLSSFPFHDREGSGFCLDFTSLTNFVAPPPSNGLPNNKVLDETKSRSLSFELNDVLHEQEQTSSETSSNYEVSEDMLADYLKTQSCYQLIPHSVKLVVFDTKLRVKKAFYALVTNGVRSAPLWDSQLNKFVGMLTITDFINILRRYYKSPIVGMDELEEQTIQTWRESERQVASVKSSLIQIDPEESLYEAVKVLIENKIHRLPIIDRRHGNALFIITHKRVLHYMYYTLMNEQQPSYMRSSLTDLGIGTYSNIATATSDTPIITAINQFTTHRISALPIVNDKGNYSYIIDNVSHY